MAHFFDWFPTILAMTGTELPETSLDGVNLLPAIQGEGLPIDSDSEGVEKRFWQWNRYTPCITSNAAMRDGDWKLIRPAIKETMDLSSEELKWLGVSMYGPEHFITQGLISDPEPETLIPAPPPPELYNIAQDPLERNDVADAEPERVKRMLAELEDWFEGVEADRKTLDDGF